MLGISAIIGAVVCVLVMIPLQFLIGKAMSNNAKIATVSTQLSFILSHFLCKYRFDNFVIDFLLATQLYVQLNRLGNYI